VGESRFGFCDMGLLGLHGCMAGVADRCFTTYIVLGRRHTIAVCTKRLMDSLAQ
jgi:hypothetical protein